MANMPTSNMRTSSYKVISLFSADTNWSSIPANGTNYEWLASFNFVNGTSLPANGTNWIWLQSIESPSSPNPTAPSNPIQSSLPQEAIYVAAAVAIVTIIAVAVALRKSKEGIPTRIAAHPLSSGLRLALCSSSGTDVFCR
jgi:hypothetical protein